MALNQNDTSIGKPAGWLPGGPVHPNVECRLFCLHQAGGGARDFDEWLRHIPSQIHVCPVQMPGRQDRFGEDPISSMATLVHELAEVVADNADLPYAIYGHCMGGLIAFEVVRQLRRTNQPLPVHLWVSSYFAPQDSPVELPKRKYLLPEEEFLQKMRQLTILSQEVLENTELLRLLLPMLKADYELCETYTYSAEPPLDCPLTIFGAESDPVLTEQKLAAWKQQTLGAFSLRLLPGDNPLLYQSSALMQAISDELFGNG